MKTTAESKAPPAKQLCILARSFRGTKDETERAAIAKAYAQGVEQLIASGKWKRIPPLEDQLPDEWMPEAFFDTGRFAHHSGERGEPDDHPWSRPHVCEEWKWLRGYILI